MATSKTSIASLAALKLGQQPIRSIDDANDSFAKLANAQFDSAAKSVLRTHEWNSVHKRVKLNPTATTPNTEFTYQYQLPADYLSVRSVKDSNQDRVDYELEGKFLLCNSSTIQLEYTFFPDDWSIVDPLLADTISAYLAYELGYTVSRKQESISQHFLDYQRNLDNAKRVNGKEGRQRKIRAKGWHTARFTGNTEYIPDDKPK